MIFRLTVLLFSLLSIMPLNDGFAFPSDDTGPLEVNPRKLDFGRIFDGDSPIKTVVLRNVTEVPVAIKDITSTCGCATPRIRLPEGRIIELEGRIKRTEIGVLKPGEKAELDVCFTTWGYTGELNKSITIRTDHEGSPRTEVAVTAKIVDSVAYEPGVLDLGTVIRGQRKSGKIKMKSVGIGDFRVSGFKNRNLFSYLEINAEKVKGGENAETIIEVIVTGTPDIPLGEQRWEVILGLQNEYVNMARMIVEAVVVPKVRFKVGNEYVEDELDFGVFSAGRGASLEIDVINLVPEIPYEPLGVEVEEISSECLLEARLETMETGKRYRLHVRVHPKDDRAGFVRGRIHIPSHHPDLYLKTFQILGWSDPTADG